MFVCYARSSVFCFMVDLLICVGHLVHASGTALPLAKKT